MRDAVMESLYAHLRAEEDREAAFLKSRPICEECGNPITDERMYDVYGEILCSECMEDKFSTDTDVWVNNHRR